jgi:L-threonine kinase
MHIASIATTPVIQRVSEGRAFGTFGELLQGVLPEGEGQGASLRHFLVTLPITESSTARFTSDSDLHDVHVLPPHKVKSQQIARDLLDHFRLPPGSRLELRSRLPEGKGLASSSADLVATARAIAAHFSLTLDTPVLLALMRRIEPSDGVMYDEITAFYHREVELLGRLGPVPPLTILAIDEGGQVDTLAFNTRPLQVSQTDATTYAGLLEDLRRAVACGDVGELGRVATRSAIMNQPRLAKCWLDQVVRICEDVGGLGVAAAHSGTQLGILLATEGAGFREQLPRAHAQLLALGGHVAVYHSRTGGE